MKEVELIDAGWQGVWDHGAGKRWWVRHPVEAGSVLHDYKEVESIIAKQRAESECKAKHDRLIAAGWRHNGTGLYASPSREFNFNIDDAVSEQNRVELFELDRREVAARPPAETPRNPYLEIHGWKPRWNGGAVHRCWYWDNYNLSKRGYTEYEAICIQSSILSPNPRAGDLRRHGFTYDLTSDRWEHPEFLYSMSHGEAIDELEKALRIAHPLASCTSTWPSKG